jgi:GTP cyclohydrolase II
LTTLYAHHRLRNAILGTADCQVYENNDGEAAVALVYGQLMPGDEILVRIQSACLYGETFLATDCDCRAQLDQSLRAIREAGCGVVIHLDQEGRGAGLLVKARGYELQDRHLIDTVEAYERMEVDLDSRNYQMAIDILEALQVDRIALITNNPRKLEALRESGLTVSRAVQRPAATDTNIGYLRVKTKKLGHSMILPAEPDESELVGPRRCVVVGAAVMDHVFRVEHNPQLGRTRQATEYSRQPGGKGFNQSVALARLGAHSTILTSRGADADALDISQALVNERVSPWFVETTQAISPQTAVLEPAASQPTYVGWLTRDHQTLSAQSISRWATELRACDAVLFTLESSSETITAVLRMLPKTTLRVMTASPRLEGQRISTSLLERIDVVIGSEDELRALHADSRRTSAEEIAANLAELCDLTIVLTDLKNPVRTVTGINPHLQSAVSVESPAVRPSDQLTAAVGNADAFSAAFTLIAIARARAEAAPGGKPDWQSRGSFFSAGTHLLDVLYEAVIAEAWVVKSGGGGYPTFPTSEDLDRWSHHAPKVLRGIGEADGDADPGGRS